jgi:hypothetical protein
VRVYGALLRAYPAEFQAAYTKEMTHVFRELAEDAAQHRGWRGLFGVWLRVGKDFAHSVLTQHLQRTHGRAVMRKSMRGLLWLALVLVVHHVVMIASLLSVALTYVAFGGGWEAWNAAPRIWTEGAMVFLPALLTGLVFGRLAGMPRPQVMIPLGVFIYWLIPVVFWIIEGIFLNQARMTPLWLAPALPVVSAVLAAIGWRISPKPKATGITSTGTPTAGTV